MKNNAHGLSAQTTFIVGIERHRFMTAVEEPFLSVRNGLAEKFH